MAILLEEEGLYDRARIYATDINEVVIPAAKAGIFPLDRMQEYTQNYLHAGGQAVVLASTTRRSTTGRCSPRA